MSSYRSRIADHELTEMMGYLGAVLVDGPKAVGKTATASRVATTSFQMDVDSRARTALATYPDQLLNDTPPVLFDEWQETPELWNLVRRAIDDKSDKGLYLLTGSSRPRDDARMHSGAGRIGRLRMRPMSLYESGHSSGAVSLGALLRGCEPSGGAAHLSIPELLERVVAGGWPEAVGQTEQHARAWMRQYVQNIVDIDLPDMGARRNPARLTRLIASLGRATSTPLKLSAVAKDVGGAEGALHPETLKNHLDALDRLMLLEPLQAWNPHMRSRSRLRSTPVHHFVDPAVGLAAMGVGVADLLRDLEAAGLFFESLVLRDLRVYSQPLGATLSSWRDNTTGQEVDAIIELPDGSWCGVEVKLGEGFEEQAAASLLNLAEKVDLHRHGAPAALIVITGGRFSYRRQDGVTVVPITALGP